LENPSKVKSFLFAVFRFDAENRKYHLVVFVQHESQIAQVGEQNDADVFIYPHMNKGVA
jgi:hypothetical protein